MLSLCDHHVLNIPCTRVPLSLTTWASYVLPPSILSAVIGLLAITGQPRTVRLALWPVLALLALRAGAGVDVSFGEPGLKILNCYFVGGVFAMTVRALGFACTKEPIVRHLRFTNSAPSILSDAIDLSANLRGIGWNWSHGLYLPCDTRPTNQVAFALWSFLSAVRYALVLNVLHCTVLSFPGVASTETPTILDDTLRFPICYIRAGIISTLTAFVIYAFVQMFYELFAALSVLFLGHDPAQWPPVLDAPWRATSLIDFWGRRWHQLFRHVFLLLAYPVARLPGLGARTGTLLGAFFASAVLHDLLLRTLDPHAAWWPMMVGFGAMGPLVLVERAFYRATGKKVGGFVGWVWTMVWMVGLGSGMVEAGVKAGGLSYPCVAYGVGPVKAVVEQFVVGFDGWLHAI